ncbi:hypothetical protein RIU76_12005 [Latilactobacillus sakei subsp. sakei]|uniref:hypothetical protein n=1 Tax=Latilactobacillus sakei TaxID=1599 RepID=UPI00285E3362|nr:hypothetical protein [Latilactobacillus sakei]MDR7925394.1 hypothetical protein [Latilactobacillus sakei subsp. sakei]
MATDGTVILGRGVPTTWLASNKSIAWSNVPVGGGQSRNVSITPSNGGTTVTVTLNAAPSHTAKVELPDFVNNIASTTAGTINNPAGEVDLPAGVTSATITLSALNAQPVVVSTSTAAGATFGAATGQVYRSQTFFASSAPSVSSVTVAVRKHIGAAQTDITVGLYAAAPGGAPTGPELASGTIPARRSAPRSRPRRPPLRPTPGSWTARRTRSCSAR